MSRLTQTIMELVEELGALQQGNYTLSSGASSRFYFDGRLLTLHPQGINLITQVTLRLARSSSAQAAGGPAIAAVPLVAALVQESLKVGNSSPIRGFIVRREPKEHGAGRRIEGHLNPGDRAILLDDTCSSGSSLLQAIKAVEDSAATVANVAVLLDRQEGGSQAIRDLGYDFNAILEMDPQGRIRPANR